MNEPLSTKEALSRLLVEVAGRSKVINKPDMRLLSRTLARSLGRAVSDHDVSKVLWSLQKEGRVKLSYTHRTGASRTGTIVRIEVLR